MRWQFLCILLFAVTALALTPTYKGIGSPSLELRAFGPPIALDIDEDGREEAFIWSSDGGVYIFEDSRVTPWKDAEPVPWKDAEPTPWKDAEPTPWKDFENQTLGMAPLEDKLVLAEANNLHILGSYKKDLLGWPKGGVYTGPPQAADLDGDGIQEILVPTPNGVQVRHTYGLPMLVLAPTPRFSTGDMDGDGKLEIATTSPNQVNLFDSDLQQVKGWPKSVAGTLSRPRISGSKIAISTSQGDFYIWNAAGQEVFKESTGQHSIYSDVPMPLLIDDFAVFAGPDNRVRAYRNGKDAWARTIENVTNLRFDPIAADLTGDQTPELLVPADSNLYILDLEGSILSIHPMDGLVKTPITLDLDGDGLLEVLTISESEFALMGKPLMVLPTQATRPGQAGLPADKEPPAVPPIDKGPTSPPADKESPSPPEPKEPPTVPPFIFGSRPGRDLGGTIILQGSAPEVLIPISDFFSRVFNDVKRIVFPVERTFFPPREQEKYLILSERKPLIDTYGEAHADTLMESIALFEASVKGRGMEPVLVYLDDKESLERFDLEPISPGEDPLLLIKGLVKSVNPSYILIIGGHKTVPHQKHYYPILLPLVHNLERPISLEISGHNVDVVIPVYSDDAYADVDGDVYALPDIPIGRFPESSDGPAEDEVEPFNLRIVEAANTPGPSSKDSYYYRDARVYPKMLDPNPFWNASDVTTRNTPSFRIGTLNKTSRVLVPDLKNMDIMGEDYDKGGIQVYKGHGSRNGLQILLSNDPERENISDVLLYGNFLRQYYRNSSTPEVLVSLSCSGAYLGNRTAYQSLPVIYGAYGGKGYIGVTTSCLSHVCPNFAGFFYEEFGNEATVGEAFISAKYRLFNSHFETLRDVLLNLLLGAHTRDINVLTRSFILYGDPSAVTFQ